MNLTAFTFIIIAVLAYLMVRLRFSEGRREAELLPLDILHRRV